MTCHFPSASVSSFKSREDDKDNKDNDDDVTFFEK